MKIIHCLRSFFPDKAGGTEIYVHGLCSALIARGVDAKVLKPAFLHAIPAYTYGTVPVLTYLEPSVPTARLQTGIEAPEGVKAFKEILLAEKPDAVHFHEVAGSNGITIYHLRAVKELGIPAFASFHLVGNICMRNSFLFKGNTPCDGKIDVYRCSVCLLQEKGLWAGLPELFSFVGKTLKKNISASGPMKIFNYPAYVRQHQSRLREVTDTCRRVFVFSDWYKNLLSLNAVDPAKIMVLPPAIAVKAQRAGTSQTNAGSVRKFVYAGRIAFIKGLHVLLRAFLAMPERKAELDIYGPVFDLEYAEEWKKKTSGRADIHWKGTFPHQELVDKLADYDALIFPSLVQETAGLVMLESFMAAVPVIGSDIWSVQELVRHGHSGFIFPRGDAAALQHILGNIIENGSFLKDMKKNIFPPADMMEVAETTHECYRREVLSENNAAQIN